MFARLRRKAAGMTPLLVVVVIVLLLISSRVRQGYNKHSGHNPNTEEETPTSTTVHIEENNNEHTTTTPTMAPSHNEVPLIQSLTSFLHEANTLQRFDKPKHLLQCLRNFGPGTILFLGDSTCTETMMDMVKYLSGVSDPLELTMLFALSGSWLSESGYGTGIPHRIRFPARGDGVEVDVNLPAGYNRNVTIWASDIRMHNRFMGHVLLSRSGMGVESFIWPSTWKDEISHLVRNASVVIINSAAHDCLEHRAVNNMSQWYESYPKYYEDSLRGGIANIRTYMRPNTRIFYRSMNPSLARLPHCLVLDNIAKRVCKDEGVRFIDIGKLVRPFFDNMVGDRNLGEGKFWLHVGSIKVVIETLMSKNRMERPKTFAEYQKMQQQPVNVGISDMMTISFLDGLCGGGGGDVQ